MENLTERLDRLRHAIEPTLAPITEPLTEPVLSTLLHQGRHQLAGRLLMDEFHQNMTTLSFASFCCAVQEQLDPKLYVYIQAHGTFLNKIIDHQMDFYFKDYFAVSGLFHSPMLLRHRDLVEPPQFWFLRIACALHRGDLFLIAKCYLSLACHYLLFDTVTMGHLGTVRHRSDQIREADPLMFRTIYESAQQTQHGHGLSLNVHHVHGNLAHKILALDAVQRLTQGPINIYIEPWHPEIQHLLKIIPQIKHLRFTLWVPDEFMRCVRDQRPWKLTPDSQLARLHGEAFNQYYQNVQPTRTVPAVKLWDHILRCQVEHGILFLMFKDRCQESKNTRQAAGPQCSRLRACVTATLNLTKFVGVDGVRFDWLDTFVADTVQHLDRTVPPNSTHRPIAIATQGLAEVFMKLGLSFGSPEAQQLNRQIFARIRTAALEQSQRMADTDGPFPAFDGGGKPRRHALLLSGQTSGAPAILHRCTEGCLPSISNVFQMNTRFGTVLCINPELILALGDRWNEDLRVELVRARGSVQHLRIPHHIKDVFRTAFELHPRDQFRMFLDRRTACHAELNFIHVADVSLQQTSDLHLKAWNHGLKTSCAFASTQSQSS